MLLQRGVGWLVGWLVGCFNYFFFFSDVIVVVNQIRGQIPSKDIWQGSGGGRGEVGIDRWIEIDRLVDIRIDR